jgi:hypothetical protein
MKMQYQHLPYILFYIKRENSASTQIEIIVQENIQHQNESMTTGRHQNEGIKVTATPIPSQAT